jgi:hypothetical protein
VLPIGPHVPLKVHSGLIHDWIGAPSPLPPPESFMDTLDPIYSSFPTHRLLDETMRAGRTTNVDLALARRSGLPF